MPIISRLTIRLKTGQDFVRVIKYNKGTFSIDLPSQLCEDMILKDKAVRVSANTETEVKSLFDAALRAWETATTKTEKVIFFEAKFQGALAKKSFEHRWKKGYVPSYEEGGISNDSSLWEFIASDISRFDRDKTELGLTFKWAVYTKITFKTNSRYQFVSGRPFYSVDEHDIQIPYTAEREQFFLSLDQSFAEMIAKVHKALGDLTPKKLMQLSDSGLKLIGK